MDTRRKTKGWRPLAALYGAVAGLVLAGTVMAQAPVSAARPATNSPASRGVPPPPAAVTNVGKVPPGLVSTNRAGTNAAGLQERAVRQFKQWSQHPYFYPGLAAVPLLLALVFLIIARNKQKQAAASTGAGARAGHDPRLQGGGRAVHTCNVVAPGPENDQLLQFNARGSAFTLHRQQEVPAGKPLPPNTVLKGWRHLWQRKLNIAWLPPEHVFLRVIHLPKSEFSETLSMVELQLERLSPIPVAQIVWSIQLLPHPEDGQQTVIVVIVARSVVENYLGRLETRGYLPDRLELAFLDQLQATGAGEADGAWVYPGAVANENTAVVAWYYGKTLRNLDFILLPKDDPGPGLREQLTQMAWAGELEGWLAGPPAWHLVGEGPVAAKWEAALREGLGEEVRVFPVVDLKALAAITARRTAQQETGTNLLPAEYAERYQQQYVDRLWMRALGAAVVVYIAVVSVYMIALQVALYRTRGVESQVAEYAPSYTNALQLKAQFEVLKDRQELKYAALDSWRAVAELLPEEVVLEGFNFNDGKRLTLNGTAPMGSVQQLFNFEAAMRKTVVGGQPLFAPNRGDNLSYSTAPGGAGLNWNFSMELKRTEVQ